MAELVAGALLVLEVAAALAPGVAGLLDEGRRTPSGPTAVPSAPPAVVDVLESFLMKEESLTLFLPFSAVLRRPRRMPLLFPLPPPALREVMDAAMSGRNAWTVAQSNERLNNHWNVAFLG